MVTETQSVGPRKVDYNELGVEVDLDAELAGLDALELASSGNKSRGAEVWSAAWPKAAAAAITVLIWQLVVWSHWRPDYVLPGPARVLHELGGLLGQGEFYRAVGTTMGRALSGYALSLAVGMVVGISVSRVPALRTAVGSLITGLQTMPSIAWFPLAILLFRLSEGAILFVVVLGAAPSIANGLIGGVDQVPPPLVRCGRVLGASGLGLYRHVMLPAALPPLVAGLKQGWAFAWRSLMAGELLVIIAARPSLGTGLQYAREFSDAPRLIAYMVVILIIGLFVDEAFSALDRSVRRQRGLLVA